MNPLLEVENVFFSYHPDGPEEDILQGLSFTIDAGATFGILGPNGSGKTTLLKILANLLRPTSGTVSFKGCPLHHFSRTDLARHIAFVPQDEEVFLPFSVEEIVLMGRSPYLGAMGFETAADRDKVEEALELTGLLPLRRRALQELSGGERQRVLLARSIAQEATLLILDEPTTHLDIHYQVEMMELYQELRHSRRITPVMSLHDLTLASSYCDRLLLIKEGRAQVIGSPDEALEEEMISRVFSVDIHQGRDEKTGRAYFLPRRRPAR